MEQKQPFENYTSQLESLLPQVRLKALELANEFMVERGYSEKKAIIEAIKLAEIWFFDLEA